MRIIAVAGVLAALAGCATPKFNYSPVTKALTEPAIGSVAVANVGDKMISQGVFVSQDVIEAQHTFAIGSAHIVGNGTYVKTGDDENAEYFSPKLGYGGGKLSRTSAFFELPSSLMLKRDGTLCVILVMSRYVCEKGGPIERKKVDSVKERTYQQALIYSGKIDNKISIGYREFTSDVSRMPTNNNVEYDLSESKTIGYKGAEIDVIEATNRFIKYRLVRNFNSAVR